MRISFREWMESYEAKQAIIGVVSGGDDLSPLEVSHLLARKVTDFSSEIRRRLKSLGAVKSMPISLRNSFERAMKDGATISDLIGKMSSAPV